MMQQDHLDHLLTALIENTIAEAEYAELAAQLRDDASARARYHEYLELHAMLRWGEAEPAAGPFTLASVPEASPSRFAFSRGGWSIAALFAVMAVVWFALAPTADRIVVETADAGVWIDRDGTRVSVHPGVAIQSGDLLITPARGTASVRYAGEATSVALHVSTAARFEFTSGAKQIDLLRGRVACDVDKQPLNRPMLLRTRDASATVLGTRFLLAANDQHTRLEVTEGAVRFKDRQSDETVETAAGWLAQVGPEAPMVTRRIADLVLNDEPVAYWRLNLPEGASVVPNLAMPGELNGRVHKVTFNRPGPPPEQFPDFEPENTSAEFDGRNDYLIVNDPGANSPFDFTLGDSITLEAWINPRSIRDDGQVYIVGKGRTKNAGFPAENHNWGLRIRGEEDLCKLSFIFRDIDNRSGLREDWHRWVSVPGFEPNSGWHHVAVTYTFGKPESLRGYINGEEVEGFWDYGGASTQAPVVDDDEVWIGSALGGQGSSTFDGLIDEVAIYRRALKADQIRNHVRREN